jgi:hypothetical protein
MSTAVAKSPTKRRNSLRDTLLVKPRIMSQTEADAFLTRRIREGAERVGWLKPCARREGKRDSVYYAVEDLRSVEDRVIKGELPD